MPTREVKQAMEELAVFNAYLGVDTAFARTVARFEQPEAEFPDMLVHLNDGGQIDFEIAEWIHQEQMAQGKRRERLTDAIREAIGYQGQNRSQYFDFVLIFPRADSPRLTAADATCFREEIWSLIEETERRWPHERFWHSPQGCQRQDLNAYSVLSKYVLKTNFYSHEKWPAGIPWIDVSLPCGPYSSDTAIEALASILKAKTANYGGLDRKPRLLVFYGAAIAYNMPWHDITFRTFGDVARKAAQLVEGPTPFEKIFLLKAVEPGAEAYEIYPTLARCT